MKNLKQLLTLPLSEIKTGPAVFILIVALLGFADSVYLAVEHFRGVIPPCTIVSGCEEVLTSSYAVIVGIPVSLLGVVYYFVILLGMFMYLESKHSNALKAHHIEILKWTLLGTIIGFVFSLWFVFIQIFIIGSYCLYCLASAITSTILFVSGMLLFKKHAINNTNDQIV
ncbi:MAG: vitamin K epoxide reductase family protein [Candidatus Paceibacterota bacterium]|jgi:uncharacterized membrane protein